MLSVSVSAAYARPEAAGFFGFAGWHTAALPSAMCRAERFGTQYLEPGKRQDLQLAFRKEKYKKDGFKTGIDIYDKVTR